MFRPELFFDLKWWVTCRVKILIVIDDGGGYSEFGGFHLGQILKVLATDSPPHVAFEVTKAHRQTGEGADLNGFRFDAHDLGQYSQIWLFGIERENEKLGAKELKALSQFMDAGGGVFATGDHENLGQAMCAEVPRVRSMRRWYWPNAGPNGELPAPSQTGPDRHDTVMGLGMGGDQSDKVPQPIKPVPNVRRFGGGIITRVVTYPHPVLCGPTGPIELLPDHMHEGKCDPPTDLGKTWTFDGHAVVEYPAVSGHREAPKVIATANTRNTTGEDFEVLAAYDGHRANVGRVVVDATWHHWFNINLIGFVNATDPANPAYDAAVVPKWNEIKAYFRNVALWLARPSVQNCLRRSGWLIILRNDDIRMTFRPLDKTPDRLGYLWHLGILARDAMGKLASRCQTTQWIIEALPEFDFDLTPWPPFPKIPMPDPPPPWLDLIDLENVALGGAVHELATAFQQEKNAREIFEKRGDEIEKLVRRGAAIGTAELFARHAESAKGAEKLEAVARRLI